MHTDKRELEIGIKNIRVKVFLIYRFTTVNKKQNKTEEVSTVCCRKGPTTIDKTLILKKERYSSLLDKQTSLMQFKSMAYRQLFRTYSTCMLRSIYSIQYAATEFTSVGLLFIDLKIFYGARVMGLLRALNVPARDSILSNSGSL